MLKKKIILKNSSTGSVYYIGFSHSFVDYDREKRWQKYPQKKMHHFQFKFCIGIYYIIILFELQKFI